LSSIAGVLETDPLGLVPVPADLVIDAHRPGGVVTRTTFLVDAEDSAFYRVFRRRDLAGQNVGVAGLDVVLAALRRRELIAAVGAACVTGGDD